MLWLYLHIRTPAGRVEDPEGGAFADLDAAWVEAIKAIREIAANNIKGGEPVLGLQVELRDPAGNCLAVVPVASVLR